jgi:hypothetical protein
MLFSILHEANLAVGELSSISREVMLISIMHEANLAVGDLSSLPGGRHVVSRYA